MALFADGATVDPGKDRVSTGKTTSSMPIDPQPVAREWHDRAERLVAAIEAAAETYSRGDEPRRQKSASELRKVMHSYEGRDNVFVAYHESCSTDLVRKLRGDMGLDTHGFRRQRPLTDTVLRDFNSKRPGTPDLDIRNAS